MLAHTPLLVQIGHLQLPLGMDLPMVTEAKVYNRKNLLNSFFRPYGFSACLA